MHWLLLIMSLPTRNATARMRIWRALKHAGCAVLRDGVYLLPSGEAMQRAFEAQAQEITAAGGSAHLLPLDIDDIEKDAQFRRLFNRADDYADLKRVLDKLRGKQKRGAPAVLARELMQARKAFAAVAAVDYFPGAAREQLQALLDEIAQGIEARLNPHEPHAPHAASGNIQRLDAAAYQGRLWATRKGLWIDRMASAWLIQRFIDTEPQFKWLAKPADCPKRALGFDFDGATFTHVGQRVTFEVLGVSFGLEEDAALMRIGAIVHYLDVGGVMPPEAVGLEAVLKGLRESAKNDDALLESAAAVFDGLYVAFGKTT
ncbi:MAG: chromate resistance protein ChrB domain-containing protein [Pseudomonadota bacterium]